MAIRLFPLKLIPDNTSIDFMGKKWPGFICSLVLIVFSFGSLAVKNLNYGIDFTGGILIEIRTETPADLNTMRRVLSDLHLGEVALQNVGDPRDVMIRISKQEGGEGEQMKVVAAVKSALAASIPGNIDYRKVDFVGPQVGEELIRSGALAIVLAFAAIMMYVWFRFEWQYGVGAVLALIHDAIITVGFMSITGLEFNLTSIAALLTIVGYSINDSVVIYDRIRENMRKYKKMPISELLNVSLNDTLSRTILTVCTTLVATLALVLFGGEVLKSFSITMFFGIVIGTYSSVYISAPVLIFLNLRKDKAA